jgi:predicted permease
VTRLLQDVRFALRSFAKAPGFTAVALAVLALGIGANSATFTIVNALLFKPVASQEDGMVGLFRSDRTKPDSFRAFAYPNYVDVREQNDVFDALAAHTFTMAGMSAGSGTRRIFVELVSANYFETLKVALAAGRGFSAAEERPAANLPVAIVPYERWHASGFDPGFVGSTIKINSVDFTIVGVAPRGFGGTMALAGPELWLPLGMFDTMANDIFKRSDRGLEDRNAGTVIVFGRLKPRVTIAAASARLDALAARLAAAIPAENKGMVLTVNPLPRMTTSTSPQDDNGLSIAGAAMMGLASTVLLIACLNLANMLLARGTMRRKEIALRLALGGARRRIVRQLVTESLVLAVAGAGLGLLCAYWATGLLGSALSAALPMSLVFDARPDVNVVAATTAFVLLATMLSGVGPALNLSRVDLLTDLKGHASDGPAAGRRISARNVLVVAQLALSLTLLSAGGLFARSALKAADATPGFSYERGLFATIDVAVAQYDEAKGRRTYRAVMERVRSLPGVESAAVASTVPFGDFHEGRGVERPGHAPDKGLQSATYRIVGAGYFKALGMPLLRGREFTPSEEESATAPAVAIIDDEAARILFPGQEPVGETIRFTAREGESYAGDQEPLLVIGIARSIREELFDRERVPHVYVPFGRNYRAAMNLHVRSASADPGASALVLETIGRELRALDSMLPVMELTTLQRFHDKSLQLWGVRMGGRLLTIFGALALLLAVAGVYGVKSYLVSRRTREIGIRIALGAGRGRVLGMVMRDAAWLTATGLAIGLPIALLLGRAMGGLLFGIKGYDPLVFVTAPLVLGSCALLASYVPARRATRVSPLLALRSE